MSGSCKISELALMVCGHGWFPTVPLGISQATNTAARLLGRRCLFRRSARLRTFRPRMSRSFGGARVVGWLAGRSEEDGYYDRDTAIADNGEQESRHVY